MADFNKFLADIQSDNADARFAAWRQAGEVTPNAIPHLGKLAGSPTPGVAKAAREALTTMAHAVGKSAQSPNRAAVVKGLLEVSGPEYPLPVRIHALRLLSGIAGDDAVAAIAKEIHNPELQEEVVYCLERIPGNAPVQALLTAYPKASDKFKPRLLAAFGHRKAKEATQICAEAMKSPNPEIQVAGTRAAGRIGAKIAAFPVPEKPALPAWNAVEMWDSLLLYADAQAKAGNASEALAIYKRVLARPEEHWQCAAIVGLGKIGTPEAAAVIFPKMKSEDAKVRITAAKAWKSMAG